MWPQSQQTLLAFVLRFGGDRLGAVTALEWLLCLGVLSALARRLCERPEHIGPALVIALGAPVVRFRWRRRRKICCCSPPRRDGILSVRHR